MAKVHLNSRTTGDRRSQCKSHRSMQEERWETMNPILQSMLKRYPELNPCIPDMIKAFELCKRSLRNNGKILVCGNGGSASDSDHIVGELMKGFVRKRPIPHFDRERLSMLYPCEGEYLAEQLQGALPAISLTSNTALLTAISNDRDADMIFAQQIYGYGQPGDIVIGISTSGNSRNVVNAIKIANAFRLHSIALTGQAGGDIKKLAEVAISVPCNTTADIQEWHIPVYHALCLLLEEEFFGLREGDGN